MSALNKWLFALVVVCCCAIYSSSQASVCFLPDGEDCGGVSSFGNYVDPSIETADQCKKDGYDFSKGGCLGRSNYHIGAYCPYNAEYVKCCSNLYAYDGCIYPLEEVGKCASKHQCVCSRTRYKFLSCANNSDLGGHVCTQITSAAGSYANYYESCLCNRGAYPYQYDRDCPAVNQVVDRSRYCVENKVAATGGSHTNTTHYARCRCPIGWSTCSAMGPEPGTRRCVNEGVTYYEKCCQCSGYTENLNVPNANRYENCYCKATYRKVTSCSYGYKLVGGRCQILSCTEAMQSYAGSSVKIINGSDWTSVGGQGRTVVFTGNSTAYLGRGINYYSAYEYARATGSSWLQARCPSSTKPSVTSRANTFYSGYGGNAIIRGIKLHHSGSFNTYTFQCINCAVNIGGDFVMYGPYTYFQNPGSGNSIYTGSTFFIYYPSLFTSSGYSYNVYNMNIYNQNRAKVWFQSDNVTVRNNFELRGIAGFRYSSVSANYTLIGRQRSGTYFLPDSIVSLYNTNWWLNHLYLSSGCMIGDVDTGRRGSVIRHPNYRAVKYFVLSHHDYYKRRRPGKASCQRTLSVMNVSGNVGSVHWSDSNRVCDQNDSGASRRSRYLMCNLHSWGAWTALAGSYNHVNLGNCYHHYKDYHQMYGWEDLYGTVR